MLSRTVEIVLSLLVFSAVGLGWLARRKRHVNWLQPFDLQSYLREDQRRSLRRSSDFTAGVQFVLLGAAIPLVYMFLTRAFFNEVTNLGMVVCGAASLVCIALGIVGIVSGRRLS